MDKSCSAHARNTHASIYARRAPKQHEFPVETVKNTDSAVCRCHDAFCWFNHERTVCSLRLHGLAAGGEKHGGHQPEAAEALRHNIALHVTCAQDARAVVVDNFISSAPLSMWACSTFVTCPCTGHLIQGRRAPVRSVCEHQSAADHIGTRSHPASCSLNGNWQHSKGGSRHPTTQPALLNGMDLHHGPNPWSPLG